MSPTPSHRNASIQAWNRLRRTMTDSELKDIAQDIANVYGQQEPHDPDIPRAIYYALTGFPWDRCIQVGPEFMALTDQWLAERMIGSPSWGELAEAQGWAEANMGKGLVP